MKLNFAGQPEEGGVIVMLTGKDLRTDVQDTGGKLWQKRPLFVDNCKDCNKFTNATGGKKNTVGDVVDNLKYGLDLWSSSQQRKADKLAAEQAVRLAQLQTAAEAQKTQQAGLKASTIKSYAVPIAIAGGLAIVGIATYFIFKKKKIN